MDSSPLSPSTACTFKTTLSRLHSRVGARIKDMHYLHRGIVLTLDIICSLVAGVTAFFAIHILIGMPAHAADLLYCVLTNALSSSLVFLVCRFYRIIIRHACLRSLPRILMALLVIAVLQALTAMVFTRNMTLAVSYAICYFFFASSLIIGLRIAMIMLYDWFAQIGHNHPQADERRIFIYGSTDVCLGLLSVLSELMRNRYRPVAIIDPDTDTRYLCAQDCRIYGRNDWEELEQDLHLKRADALVFINGEYVRREEDRIVRWCNDAGIPIYQMQPPEHWQGGKPRPHIRAICIEDLLGREEITINEGNIGELVRGRSILVTGAAGSIGSEIVRQLCRFSPGKITLLDAAESPLHQIRVEIEDHYPDICICPAIADVRNRARCAAVVAEAQPAIILHAAAYKHVPLMEEHPCEAVLTNVLGTRNMADLALEYGVEKFVMISTDKAVNPTNVMGTTKRIACMYVQSLNDTQHTTQFITTRFGNVLGSNGSVIPRFREQIEHGGPVTVTHPDIVRYFMTIPEACRLVLQAATMGQGGEIFCFDMGKPVKIVHLAERMIRLCGLIPGKDIAITFTGLRPGEKLYEEVLAQTETTTATTHAKIRVAHARRVPHDDIAAGVDALTTLARSGDAAATVRELKALVPEYHSQNSPWETL